MKDGKMIYNISGIEILSQNRKGAGSMKLKAMILGIIIAGSTLAYAVYTTGWGKLVSATPTHQIERLTHPVGYLSIYNAGPATIYCLVNMSTSQLVTAMVTDSNAIQVLPSYIFTFDTKTEFSIDSIVYATASAATSSVYLAGY